ncbi:MAG: rod shape-determining protein MreD [Prolixibacteraceae bacterium]|nr:rod shape-determining protein MreD [Prolixibacteraceae bacterium]
MGQQIIKYFVMFVTLILIQVLVLNQVQFSGYVNPYLYILFILLLPLNTPRYSVLLLAFVLGLSIDIFSNSLGIHSAATVLIAFIRPFVIRSISNREEDRSDYPGLRQNGFRWFLYYTAIMVIVHHTFLFYVEVFTFVNFWTTLSRVLLSSLFSIFVIVLSQYLIFRE